MSHPQEWKKKDVERCIGEILARAKSGQTQFIKDSDGEFEISFRKSVVGKLDAGDFLSRGGPVDE